MKHAVIIITSCPANFFRNVEVVHGEHHSSTRMMGLERMRLEVNRIRINEIGRSHELTPEGFAGDIKTNPDDDISWGGPGDEGWEVKMIGANECVEV